MPRLTKRAVDAAKTDGSGWTWLGDDEVPGFGALIYPSGTKTFALRYRTRSGRQRMLKLGQYGELTVQEGRDLARKEKIRVLEGEDPRTEREREAAGIATVCDLMSRWIEEHAKPHRKSWREDERRAEGRIRPVLGRIRLDDLTPDRLASWHQSIGKDAPTEANRCLETLRAAWRWAGRHGVLPDGLQDPTTNVTRFRERSRERWLRREELERLMAETRKEDDPHVRAAIPLLLLTGLRKAELLSARWEEVDLERAEIRLAETKSGEAQVRLLPSPAVAILRDLPRFRESPFVFPSPTDPQTHRKDIKSQWEAIRKAAGLEDVTLHNLRRTAGSFMAQAGIPIQVIQHVLGHAHPGVTKVYARLASENEREALEVLARELSGILGNGTDPDPDARRDLRGRLKALLEDREDPDLAERLRALVGDIAESSP